jgi:hypothetical protein
MIFAALGDTDEAMNWLEKGYKERFNPGVLQRPGFDPLRSDPRFEELADRIGLPSLNTPHRVMKTESQNVLPIDNELALHAFVPETAGMAAPE